jgi:hypothetical protein
MVQLTKQCRLAFEIVSRTGKYQITIALAVTIVQGFIRATVNTTACFEHLDSAKDMASLPHGFEHRAVSSVAYLFSYIDRVVLDPKLYIV